MSPFAWGVLGAASAVWVEWTFRRFPGHLYLWYSFTWVGNIGVSYAIFQVMRQSENLISGVVVFSVATQIIRIAVQIFLLNEPVALAHWVAFALVVAAGFIKYLWR